MILTVGSVNAVLTVSAVLAILTVGTSSLNAGILFANPPVAVLADEGSKAVNTVNAVNAISAVSACRTLRTLDALSTVSAVSASRTLSCNTGVGITDPPVAILADNRSETVCTCSTCSAISTCRTLCTCRTLRTLRTGFTSTSNENSTNHKAHHYNSYDSNECVLLHSKVSPLMFVFVFILENTYLPLCHLALPCKDNGRITVVRRRKTEKWQIYALSRL